jgi:hypothetical protein
VTANTPLITIMLQADEPKSERWVLDYVPLTRQDRNAMATLDDRGSIRRHQDAGAPHTVDKPQPGRMLLLLSRRCRACLRTIKRHGGHSSCCRCRALCELCP